MDAGRGNSFFLDMSVRGPRRVGWSVRSPPARWGFRRGFDGVYCTVRYLIFPEHQTQTTITGAIMDIYGDFEDPNPSDYCPFSFCQSESL